MITVYQTMEAEYLYLRLCHKMMIFVNEKYNASLNWVNNWEIKIYLD